MDVNVVIAMLTVFILIITLTSGLQYIILLIKKDMCFKAMASLVLMDL